MIPDFRWFFFSCFVLILALPTISNATPFIWVDTVNGSDTSTNYMQPTDPLRTYARAIALGADGDTLGVKVKPGSAMPSASEAFIINSHKPDRTVTHNKHEVIAGHGELPSTDVETSAEAGLKVTTTRVWLTYTAPNGQLAEYTTTPIETVEAY